MIDYTALRLMAENSRRECFITDERLKVLWTNSDAALETVVRCIRRSDFKRISAEESVFRYKEDLLVKFTPIIENKRTVMYFIEIYPDKQVFDMFTKSHSFDLLAEDYRQLREGLEDGMEGDPGQSGRLLTRSVNRSLALELLSGEGYNPAVIDLYVPLERCCEIFKTLSGGKIRYIMSSSLEFELYSCVDVRMLECVVVELLINAVKYPIADKLQIRLNAYKKDSKIVIEILDNGTAANLKRIKTAAAAGLFGAGIESPGIALAQLFVKKCDGALEFKKNKAGGLEVRMMLNACSPELAKDSGFKSTKNSHHKKEICDILKKSFDSTDIDEITRLF